MMRSLTLTTLFLLSGLVAFGQNDFWTNSAQSRVSNTPVVENEVFPEKLSAFTLDLSALRQKLRHAPEERSAAARSNPLSIVLPLPDGSREQFNFVKSAIMAPELAAKYPKISTYFAEGVENPAISLRAVITAEHGFHVIMHSPKGTIFIMPSSKDQVNHYISFFANDVPVDERYQEGFTCEMNTLTHDETDFVEEEAALLATAVKSRSAIPTDLKTYRFALATTGELYNFYGNTPTSVMDNLVIDVNKQNSVLEREVAVRLILIANNDLLFYSDPATDPYTNGSTGAMLGENPDAINSIVGFGSYDIGHVWGTNGGGLASLASVCTTSKANGVTCRFGAYIDVLFYRLSAHEVGHQFDAPHTFNFCDGNENPGTGYEPGSGSTIMSYSGAGCIEWVQNFNEEYYHINSILRIRNFTENAAGSSCATSLTTSNNNMPEASIPELTDGFYIPISTPFELTGAGTDDDGDDLTYCFEQYDLGPMSTLGTPILSAPAFRSFPPTTSPTRTFPRMTNIVNNFSDQDEVLPTYNRELTFRLTVRDNHPEAGAIDWAEIGFEATESAGPFRVTEPNVNNISLEVGAYTEVKWDVANTDNNLVNCKSVNIKLSEDGGFTYPYTLVENVPNDGSHFVVIPDVVTTTARVRVEAADNIFFDISNNNFEITPPSQAGFSFQVTPFSQQVCLPESPVIDLNVGSLLDFTEPVTIAVSGIPQGATPVFTANPVLPGSTGNNLTFNTDNVTSDGNYEITIKAFVAGTMDTSFRTVNITTIYSDFSSFAVTSPAPGMSGVEVVPTFEWTANGTSDAYDIEIATNPAFEADDIVDAVYDYTSTSFQSDIVLSASTLYYWRVRPKNICGDADFTSISTFHTVALSCEIYDSSDGPKFISESQLPNVISTISVFPEGPISDVNILNINVDHNSVQHVDGYLKGPDGTEVKLFSQVCGNTQKFSLGFDDQAPTQVPCPPVSGLVHTPEESLSVFNGLGTSGDWQFRIKVVDTDGDGGFLNSWRLELCSSSSQNGPVLVNNKELPLPPTASRKISLDFLLTEDDNNTAEELIYTIVSTPINGDLELDGTVLTIGDQFKQSDIDLSKLQYNHLAAATTNDQFGFTVIDGDGGWIDITQFNILIDPNVVLSTIDVEKANSTLIFPNPTQDVLNVEFASAFDGEVVYSIFNVQGKSLLSGVIGAKQKNTQINTAALSNGIYLLKFQSGNAVFTKKVTIQQ